MDLSEMLDSNFVLGVQLKKAKKEMMDLRSHLYRVKKERESVALQMDAVRCKHMEEEKAKSVSLMSHF
jgi:glycerol-3-phosphate responsive antiterminator